jgi:hypothetical protein
MTPHYRSLVAGGYFSSDPTNTHVPRSIRTNNPGALNTATWVGQMPGFITVQWDAHNNNTAIFETPEQGVRAWLELLKHYKAHLPTFNLKAILDLYSGHNPVVAQPYAMFVSGHSGVPTTQPIDLTNLNMMRGIAKGFFWYEAGQQSPLLDAQVDYGLQIP